MKWKTLILAGSIVAGGCSAATVDDDLPLTSNLSTLEIGQTYRYRFQIHCGMEWLGEFNDKTWVADNPIFRGAYPESLREFFTDPEERISPELWTRIMLVSDVEIQLTLPDGTRETSYYPTDRESSGCA